MDMDRNAMPSIIYTSDDSADVGQSDDSADVLQSDDSADIGQSDDSADAAQSDDSADAVQSDDSGEVGHLSDTTYIDSDEPTYIAPGVCRLPLEDDAHLCLLDGSSDGATSPAIVPPFALRLPHPPAITSAGGGGLFIANQAPPQGLQPVGLSRSPSPSESSTQSSGSQEQLGLLSQLHQYQPLCSGQQPQHTTVHYAHLDTDHSITTKIRCDLLDPLNMLGGGKDGLTSGGDLLQACPERWLVADINIDSRYKDAFYVKWNWRKIRSSCALLNFGILMALLIVGVALLVQMPQGHECDPSREWWQGHVSYHVLVPSFKDTNGDGIGDLQGVVAKLDYIQSLGASMVRLAPLFERAGVPHERLLGRQEGEYQPLVQRRPTDVAWNLTRVDPALGSGGEVQLLAALLHERGMKLLLDLPLAPGLPTFDVSVPGVSFPWPSSTAVSLDAALAEARRALQYWLKLGVDGFAMPDLHKLVDKDNAHKVVDAVESWRDLLDRSPRVGGQQRILVMSTKLVRALPDDDHHHRVHPRSAAQSQAKTTRSAEALADAALVSGGGEGEVAAPPRKVDETIRHRVQSRVSQTEGGRGWSSEPHHSDSKNSSRNHEPAAALPIRALLRDADEIHLLEEEEELVFTLTERLLRATHLLEEHLHLSATPSAVMKQIEKALQLSSSPSAPWIIWSMGGVGAPRLAELAPIGMRLKLQPYHLMTDQGVDLTGSAEGAPEQELRKALPPVAAAGHGAQRKALHPIAAAGHKTNDASEKAVGKEGSAAHYWSSVGRNFLLLFLPGSTSLYYGDEVDVTAPRDIKNLGWAGIMAWSGESFGSFSEQTPWLGLGDHYEQHNVDMRRNTSVAATARLADHKRQQPPLFINGLFNYEGDFHPTNTRNYKMRFMDESLLILERFYPRRRQYTVVANLGSEVQSRDLSHYYYGGSVVASSHGKQGYIKFRSITLMPSEVLVCVLDK